MLGSVVPDLVGEVAAEKAPNLSGPRVPAVEEPPRSEVVELPIYRELQVRRYHLVWVILKVVEASEDTLSHRIASHSHSLVTPIFSAYFRHTKGEYPPFLSSQ